LERIIETYHHIVDGRQSMLLIPQAAKAMLKLSLLQPAL
jgi:hypothetical protein